MKRFVIIALFISLSAIGGMMKVPVGVGSIALDAVPALVASILIGPWGGALVGGFGHLVSALTGGFPLGPFHLLIAGEMALLIALFSYMYTLHKWMGCFFFWVGNSLLLPLPFYFFLHSSFYFSIVPALLIGSFLNMILFLLIMPKVQALMAHEQEVVRT